MGFADISELRVLRSNLTINLIAVLAPPTSKQRLSQTTLSCKDVAENLKAFGVQKTSADCGRADRSLASASGTAAQNRSSGAADSSQ